MSEVVHTFTTTIPRWQPYVVPVDFATATEEQHAAMQMTPSNKGISPYVLTLAHDPETLAVRSPLFNLIMYGKTGWPEASASWAPSPRPSSTAVSTAPPSTHRGSTT